MAISANGLVFVGIFILVLLGLFMSPGDPSLVVVERDSILSSGGPIAPSSHDVSVQGAFLGASGFEQSQVSVYNHAVHDEAAAFFGFLAPVGTSRLSLASYSYVVRPGDTLSQIAEDFDIPPEKLRRANPAAVRMLRAGQEIIIPRALAAEVSRAVDSGLSDEPVMKSGPEISRILLKQIDSFFIMPARGWNWGELHDENAVDIANACGTSIRASAPGIVIEESSKNFWNRGYGNYLLVEHEDGTKTRYAHTLRNLVAIGERVEREQEIALMGNSGNTNGPTGCHLHFEVINAQNPFGK